MAYFKFLNYNKRGEKNKRRRVAVFGSEGKRSDCVFGRKLSVASGSKGAFLAGTGTSWFSAPKFVFKQAAKNSAVY